MTIYKVADTALRDQRQDSVSNQVPWLGDAFIAATAPPPNPSRADDPQALYRAHRWIEEECLEVADNDRYAAADYVAAKLRNGFGNITEARARDLCQFWSDLCCDPPLEPFEIERAVITAYACPQAPLASSSAGTEVLPLPADRTLPLEPETATADTSMARRPMSAKERMAKRRAELKRLGLPAKHKGRLKDAVTPDVTPPVTSVVTQPSDVTEVIQ